MLGYDADQRVVSLNDTAELYAYLYDADDANVDPDDLIQVDFTILRPDGTREVAEGEVLDDGAGFLRYANTDLPGEYKVVATFTFLEGQVRSTKSDFQVADPFKADLNIPLEYERYTTLTGDEQLQWQVDFISSRVWDKMEDLFGSTDGGPWMRDMTMNVFSVDKLSDFIEEALFNINVYNPPTDFWIDKFTPPTGNRPNSNATILIQATWVAVIRHLMRSYAEQSLPTGGQVTYEDRRDYLQRWGTIYQIENQLFDQLLKLWKRQFLGLGSSKLLVSNKAGRLLPAPLRTRNIGRGYY